MRTVLVAGLKPVGYIAPGRVEDEQQAAQPGGQVSPGKPTSARAINRAPIPGLFLVPCSLFLVPCSLFLVAVILPFCFAVMFSF